MDSSNREIFLNKLYAVLLIGVLLVTAWFLYKPGFSGGFIFDDYHSLKKLSAFEGEVTLEKSKHYLSLSDTGYLKRPISIFSFLIDAQEWPAEAFSFKRTNVILHMFNGLLLFLLIRMVTGRSDEHASHKNLIAFFAAGFWLLHPFLVSTTLYVVQRMAMLPVTFTLLGVILFVKARFRYQKNDDLLSKLYLASTVFGFTLLAMLSKENGVLFLPLLFLFEVFIIRKYLRLGALNKRLNAILFVLPVLLFTVALLLMMFVSSSGYDVRSFSLGERLLTQFRVVADYIFYLLVPKYFTYGVFGDGYVISKGLLNPISTLFSLIFISSLLVFAWLFRNKYVLFSFTVFFFFLSHLIESTVIPLEIYYEHRNYLASLFIGVPLALVLVKMIQNSKVFIIIPIALLLLISFLTHLRVSIWSDNFILHEQTMKKFPESARAYTMTADFYARSGYRERTMQILNEAILLHNDLGFQLNRLQYMCSKDFVDYYQIDQYYAKLFDDFKTVPIMQDDLSAFTVLFKKLLEGKCETGKDQEYADKMYEGLSINPYKDRKYMIMLQSAYGAHYYLEREDVSNAVVEIKKLLHEFHRYYDFFEGLDGLFELKEFDIISELLKEAEVDYSSYFKYKPDTRLVGEKIKMYQAKIKEVTEQ